MGFINLQAAKCPSCGASIQVDPRDEATNCPYCGSAFIVEKAINNYNIENVHVNARGPIHIERKKTKYEIDAEQSLKEREMEARLIKDPDYREWKEKQSKEQNKLAIGILIFIMIILAISFLKVI